jgi:hypothetical protein
VSVHHHGPELMDHGEAPPRPSAAGAVVLDIGPGAGVAIVRTGAAMCGLEMEIRRAGDDWSGQHVYIRRRDGAGTPQFAAIFGSLDDGSYEFRVRGSRSPAARATVTIHDGSVALADWS